MATFTNQSTIEVDACDEIVHIQSNSVTSELIELTVVKTQSCNIVFPGMEVEYCTEVTNPSNTTLTDVVFRDTIPTGMTYVPGSFEVDESPQTPVINGQEISYTFNLPADPATPDHTTVVICFKVTVDRTDA